jgi:hypothetical protein
VFYIENFFSRIFLICVIPDFVMMVDERVIQSSLILSLSEKIRATFAIARVLAGSPNSPAGSIEHVVSDILCSYESSIQDQLLCIEKFRRDGSWDELKDSQSRQKKIRQEILKIQRTIQTIRVEGIHNRIDDILSDDMDANQSDFGLDETLVIRPMTRGQPEESRSASSSVIQQMKDEIRRQMNELDDIIRM